MYHNYNFFFILARCIIFIFLQSEAIEIIDFSFNSSLEGRQTANNDPWLNNSIETNNIYHLLIS